MRDAEPTADGHHVVVDGRRWRATDPAIPAALRAQIVHELMDARREVAAGNRTDDHERVAAARDRVQDAKVALGERGTPWWEQPIEEAIVGRLRSVIRALLRSRERGSSICPSDAARVVGGEDWRDVMPLAREVAFAMQLEGVVEVRQLGVRIDDSHGLRGPIRIARGRGFA